MNFATDIMLSFLYIVTFFYTIFWLITLLDTEPEKKKNPSKELPYVSVAIPCLNEEGTVTKAVQSIIDLDYPKEKIEIIVVNDGSTDKTMERVKEFIEKNKDNNITLINQENSGKWHAMNQVLEIAKGEFFACLDADSFVKKDTLKKMLPHFREKSVGAVLPLLKIKDPKNLLQKIQWYEYLVNMFYKRLLSYLNCIHVAPGPFSIYRKKIIKDLGGFRKGHYTEDLEMGLRLQKHNYRLIQLMDAEVYTHTPDNMKSLYRQRMRWNKGSVLNVWDYKKMMFNKDYGDFGMFQMPLILTAGFIALFLVAIILYQNLVKPLSKTLYNLSLVNFDIFTFISNFKLNLTALDINYYRLIILLVMFSVSIAVFVIAHRYTKERITKQGIFPLVTFLFFYYIFLGIVWGSIAKDLILRRKEKW